MTEPEPRYRCAQCALSFRIADRPRKAAVSRCPTCKLVFWHGQPTGGSRVIVGITSQELQQQTGGAA
jgi:hypothetical protein